MKKLESVIDTLKRKYEIYSGCNTKKRNVRPVLSLEVNLSTRVDVYEEYLSPLRYLTLQ
jgi:hypothetical protein